MPTPRNYDQLLIAKQFFDDAVRLVSRQDGFSLCKAILSIDLSIELTIKTIILNLDPNRQINPKKDLQFHEAWAAANDALENRPNTKPLSEPAEAKNLHLLRNNIQHNGHTPSVTDCKRYLIVSRKLLKNAFHDAFGYDFDDFRTWEFLQNVELKQFLIKCDETLADGKIKTAYFATRIACHDVLAIFPAGSATVREQLKEIPENNQDVDQWDRVVWFAKSVKKVTDDLCSRIDAVTIEMTLVGMGFPVLEVRRFLDDGLGILSANYGGGKIGHVYTADVNKESYEDVAKFRLGFLYRLLRALDDQDHLQLEKISVQIPFDSDLWKLEV